MPEQSQPAADFEKLRTLILDLANVQTFEEACGQIAGAALGEEVDCAAVYLGKRAGAPRLIAHAGLDETFVATMAQLEPGGLLAGCLLESKAFSRNLADIGALALPDTTKGPLRGLLVEPMLVEEKAAGLLLMGTRTADAIADARRPYLATLAALAATALLRGRARQGLERREALFRSMYQNAPLAYQSLDGAGNIVEVNPAWESLFGYRREEVLGRSITEFLDEASIPTLVVQFPAFQERGYVDGPEFIIRPGHGTARRVRVNGRASYDASGNFLRTHCLLTDVTEAHRVDEEMRALLAEKQLILDNVVVGLAVFRNRDFVTCNNHFERLMGYLPGELIGQSAAVIHRDEAHFLERGPKIYAAISQGKNFTEEEAFKRKDGTLIWLHVTGRASDPAQPSAAPSVWIFVDLSERHRAEEEIRRLNASLEARVKRRTQELEAAMREMEAFSYSISHDLRAPLRAINGFAQALLDKPDLAMDAQSAAMFERIVRNSNKMGRLIDDILEYSRLGRANLLRGPVDLGALARSIAAEQREAFPATRVEIGDLPVVHGDATMLRQVLENLIGNAFKYSAPKATPVVRITAIRDRLEDIISVGDNGVGFDMNHMAKLFGMFQRLHPEHDFPGTGVGLAIVKRLVERHGGRVYAEAQAERGARFSFVLPTRSPQPCEPEGQDSPPIEK